MNLYQLKKGIAVFFGFFLIDMWSFCVELSYKVWRNMGLKFEDFEIFVKIL